jgi:hypothetical protein
LGLMKEGPNIDNFLGTKVIRFSCSRNHNKRKAT